MIGRVITAALRGLQVQKILAHPKVQRYIAVAKTWYDAQPRKVQLVVGVAVTATVAVVLLA